MTRQTTLFDDPLPPHALSRRSNPETSREAAERHEASGRRASNQQTILRALRAHQGRTAAELGEATGLGQHECARRLPELLRSGAVQVGPARCCTVKGSRQRTWFAR